MKFRFIVLTAVLLASCSLFASVTEEEKFSFKLNDGGRLSVSNVNGSITITGGDGDSVEIIAYKKADNQEQLDGIEIDISHSADSIVVETDLPESSSWFSRGNQHGQVRYEIRVPALTNLDSIETVNGSVKVSGVSGNVDVKTVNGSLNCSDLVADARFATVNGSIDASFLRLEGQQKAKAETVNGRVTLRLPQDADVRVDADTLNGGINGRDFDLETDRGLVGKDLNGDIGNGSARLNIDTVNGSIRIRSN